MYQYTLDDWTALRKVEDMPGRTAFIDECGSFGFDFSTDGASKYYILYCVIIENCDIKQIHQDFLEVKKNNGFAGTEMKSSKIGDDYKRRSRVMSMLMPIPFRITLLVADKQAFIEGSPLTEYKKSFIKYLHGRLYNQLYHVYPKLKIIEDEVGSTEFQNSFREYVVSRRPDYNLFNEYDFDYVDSKDEILVQLADFIGGSVYKSLTDNSSPNYMEMLKGKIVSVDEFPNKKEPYWGTTRPENRVFDKTIYALSQKSARDYIDHYSEDTSLDKRAQVAFLRYLLFYVDNINPTRFVSSHELQLSIQEYTGTRITKSFLFRRVVAPLRDNGVILSSSSRGYKIPISSEDIVTYLNQTHSTVSPMLNRIRICRELVLQETSGNLDILNDPAFARYKNYFD